MKNTLLALRSAQATAATIIMILTAFVTNWWRTVHLNSPPTEITFLVATSVATLLSSSYHLLALSVPKVQKWSHPVASMTIDALLGVMWFGGFVALPIFLRERVCFGSVCRMAYTSVCFGAGEWALCIAAVVVTGVVAVRESKAKHAAREAARDVSTDISSVEYIVEKDLEAGSMETESIDVVLKN